MYGGPEWVFLENAGGTQVPQCVVDASAESMSWRWRTELGRRQVADARRFLMLLLNVQPAPREPHAEEPHADGSNRSTTAATMPESEWGMVGAQGHVVLGASASSLLRSLALAYAAVLREDDEVVVCEWSHEAHISPWLEAARLANATVRWWRLDPKTKEPPTIDANGEWPSLERLLGPKTKVVALTHVSNILGTICDVASQTAAVRRVTRKAGWPGKQHEKGNLRSRSFKAHEHNSDTGSSKTGLLAGPAVVVDGVAFVAHRCVDVAALGVDWYSLSCYKAFGPHAGALYGSVEAMETLAASAPNHAFVEPGSAGPARWELGTHNQEAAAGIAAIGEYFATLANLAAISPVVSGTAAKVDSRDPGRSLDRSSVVAAYELIERLERTPTARLLEYLASRPRVTVLGSPTVENRVPTISLVHSSYQATEVVELARENGIVCRHGTFLAPRLLSALDVPLEEHGGVLRFSLVHYNTLSDVERLIEFLDFIGF
eukprot:CAMPEP_0172634808 /NCGR_PEP_ID=MMETSP1068-20121228/196261_1 /TAXON_ID=35684 /ORGANISM="Pseudopedinella elastica, Strain CCMP716" /LENGTH=489 /DNA_ID=CAMNT_0013446821 /DNA_START=330 /DNA_END=1799 /DNA_ORIENTATION=-